MKVKKIATTDVQECLSVDQVSLRYGVFTVRRGFFYTHGFTADGLVANVKAAFPNACIIDSGEVWKPFRGSASVAQQSHWFVKFTLNEIEGDQK